VKASKSKDLRVEPSPEGAWCHPAGLGC